MSKRGKRSGYKGWLRKNVKCYELCLRKGGQSVGYARIVQQGEKWYGEIYTDIKGLFSQPQKSEPYKYFVEALSWLNDKRRFASKKIFG